jgi:hypothetical protein
MFNQIIISNKFDLNLSTTLSSYNVCGKAGPTYLEHLKGSPH